MPTTDRCASFPVLTATACDFDASVMVYVSAHEPVECPPPRGGVIAMRPLPIHFSSRVRSDEPRRVLHIEYADSLEIGHGIQLDVV
jgi:hypothetical protein